MLPIDFEGTNMVFTKPQDMSDEQCLSVRAFKGKDKDGFSFVLLAFQPNKDDVIAINEGRPIMLKILGDGMPPVALYTYDVNYNANV